MIAINFRSMIIKISMMLIMIMAFDSIANAQFFDGFFKRDKIQQAKDRRARVDRAHSDVITTQGPSKNLNQAVRREKRAEEADADVIEVNQGSDVELNPFWSR